MRSRLPQRLSPGFSLLEVMLASCLLLGILAITFSILNSSLDLWRRTNAEISVFQNSRVAFDVMIRRLSQATLNTYWDYFDASFTPYRQASTPATFVPKYYGRYSDLAFTCGNASSLISTLPPNCSAVGTHAVFFQAPTGLTTQGGTGETGDLLSVCGYFVAFGNDNATRPSIYNAPACYRWRLMEVSAPTELFPVFKTTSQNTWFTSLIAEGKVHPLIDNVIALIVWPRLSPLYDSTGSSLSSDYSYNSRTSAAWTGSPLVQPVQASQLPPNLQITMVVIDEEAALHIQTGSTAPTQITEALAGLFSKSDVTDYATDLGTLETRLKARRINYRVFSTTVALPESQGGQTP
ncbi:MAG: hypothetical protein ACFUZC_04050 [Chthoniobacteraceae bacterium]